MKLRHVQPSTRHTKISRDKNNELGQRYGFNEDNVRELNSF